MYVGLSPNCEGKTNLNFAVSNTVLKKPVVEKVCVLSNKLLILVAVDAWLHFACVRTDRRTQPTNAMLVPEEQYSNYSNTFGLLTLVFIFPTSILIIVTHESIINTGVNILLAESMGDMGGNL